MNPKTEPVAFGGMATALAVAAIAFVRAFGIYDLTPEQTDATLGLLAALIAFGTFVVRARVTPVDHAERRITEAFFADPATDDKPVL